MSGPEARLIQFLREPAARDRLADRFVVEREAGIGGMGIVYRALDETSGAVVALKVLRKTDASSRRRFANEVEALERLAHPAIVRYVAHGMVDEDQPYLAMEWVEGKTLSERLDSGPLSIEHAIALGLRVASALRAAHELGVIHRDIKPGNVLLPDGDIERAKVADFGLSRFLGAPHVTTSGGSFGTPGYAAPEQVRGVEGIDERADLFSLGCLLFRALTNVEAFAGAEVLTVIAKLVLEDAPRAQAIRNDVPPALDALIARLLAKDPKDRPASAGAVIAALEEAQRGAGAPSAPRKTRSPRIAPWLLAGALLLGLGGIALAWHRAAAPKEAPAASGVSSASSASMSASPPKATRLTDLSASPTCRPEAVADYREGLGALRAAMPERAYKVFQAAMTKDPACPEVLLRVLQTGRWMRPIAEQREHLQRVLVHRDALAERDRVLLDALMATLSSEPPDFDASSRILNDGARRFPEDVELVHLAANSTFLLVRTAREIKSVLASALRATELDPGYADAWQVLGWTYERTGQVGEEANAYAHCQMTSPTSVDCISSQVTLLRRRGLCKEAESLTRQWIAHDPSSDRSYQALAALVASQGAPRESIEEVLRMRWAHLQGPDAHEEIVRVHDRAKLAAWTGDFGSALALGEELERRTAEDPHIEAHLRAARVRIDALLETGKAAEAAGVAEQFLRRKVAWTNSPLSGDRGETGAAYYEPNLLGIAVASPRFSLEEWRTSADAWEHAAQTARSWTKMNPYETWTLRWGSAVPSRVDAAEAIRNAPAVSAEDPVLPTLIAFHPGLLQAYEGRLRLAAGEASPAARLLEDATQSCQGTEQPYLNTRAHLWLGLASERLGKTREACDAYAVVAHRWGKSTPRSVTAIEAAKRRHALGCVPL